MKRYSKLALLAAAILILVMTACARQASTPAVTTPTGGAGDFPPIETPTPGSIADFGTQTAIAQTPQADRTPQVVVNTPTAGEGAEQGGGQATTDPNAAPTGDTNQGGGQGEQPAATQDPNAGGGAAVPAAPAAPVERPQTYTIQTGEHPFCIARRFDVDPIALLNANNLSRNSVVLPGTTLRIPATGNWSSSYGSRTLRAHPADYTVVAGDTVNSVACKFGDVTPEAIVAANNLGQPANLTPGTTIRIP